MKWKKLGCVFEIKRPLKWMISHAAIPTPYLLTKNLYQVFFSTRDNYNHSYIGYFVFDLENPFETKKISQNPILSPGGTGFFDDSGTTCCSIVKNGNKLYLYYVGWSLPAKVPFEHSIGLATSSTDRFEFKKISNGPILSKSIYDTCFCSGNFVMIDKSKWRMWYASCDKWELDSKQKFKHYYNIKYAESIDGINWCPTGKVCLNFENPKEYAFSRPCIIKEAEIYKCWYSVRGESYRIGYAESTDGIQWIRKDHIVGIDVSKTGWDSEMIAYPYVFDHKGTRYMLYNGNEYGKTGIGLAVLENN